MFYLYRTCAAADRGSHFGPGQPLVQVGELSFQQTPHGADPRKPLSSERNGLHDLFCHLAFLQEGPARTQRRKPFQIVFKFTVEFLEPVVSKERIPKSTSLLRQFDKGYGIFLYLRIEDAPFSKFPAGFKMSRTRWSRRCRHPPLFPLSASLSACESPTAAKARSPKNIRSASSR